MKLSLIVVAVVFLLISGGCVWGEHSFESQKFMAEMENLSLRHTSPELVKKLAKWGYSEELSLHEEESIRNNEALHFELERGEYHLLSFRKKDVICTIINRDDSRTIMLRHVNESRYFRIIQLSVMTHYENKIGASPCK